MRRSEARIRNFVRDLERQGGAGGAGGLGRGGGGFTNPAGALRAALPVVAVAAARSRPAAATGKAAEKYAEAARSGDYTTRELASTFVASLPIARDFFEGMQSWSNAIWPIAPALDNQIKAQMKLTSTLKNSLAVMNTSSTVERARLLAQQEYEETLDRIRDVERERAGKRSDVNYEAQARTAAAAAEQQRRYAAAIRDGKVAEAERNREARKIIQALEESVHAFGKSAMTLELEKLAKAGATAWEIAHAQALIVVRDNRKAATEADEEARRETERRAKSVEDELARLKEERDLLGLSERDKLAYKLATQGATEAQIEAAQAIQDQIDGLKKFEQQQERAKQIIEETRTPLEQYRDQLIELGELHDLGLIDDTAVNRAVAKIRGASREISSAGTFQADLRGFGGSSRALTTEEKQLDALTEIKNATNQSVDIMRDLRNRLAIP